METELFVMMDLDWVGMRNYIAQYNPTKLGLMGEEKQKCFMIYADGPCGHYGVPSRVFWVFPKFIISYMTGNGCSRQYDIESHTLGSDDLRCLKHAKLCYYKDDMISKVLSRFQSGNQCEKKERNPLFSIGYFEMGYTKGNIRCSGIETTTQERRGRVLS